MKTFLAPRILRMILIVGAVSACQPEDEDSATGMDKPCAFAGDSQEGNINNSWIERSRIACGTCEELPPQNNPDNLLLIKNNGRFEYTYSAFVEGYSDYQGSYDWNPEDGTIEFKVDGIREPPDDFDGVGTIHFLDDGRLILNDIWLGDEFKSCGYEFVYREWESP